MLNTCYVSALLSLKTERWVSCDLCTQGLEVNEGDQPVWCVFDAMEPRGGMLVWAQVVLGRLGMEPSLARQTEWKGRTFQTDTKAERHARDQSFKKRQIVPKDWIRLQHLAKMERWGLGLPFHLKQLKIRQKYRKQLFSDTAHQAVKTLIPERGEINEVNLWLSLLTAWTEFPGCIRQGAPTWSLSVHGGHGFFSSGRELGRGALPGREL